MHVTIGGEGKNDFEVIFGPRFFCAFVNEIAETRLTKRFRPLHDVDLTFCGVRIALLQGTSVFLSENKFGRLGKVPLKIFLRIEWIGETEFPAGADVFAKLVRFLAQKCRKLIVA